ncbi:uncharacterized protein LOC116255848 isoform X2 [Nymphaea colorata]|uniref:uncharacterized protein LOC116255848 isoform X2 n=1 Tax=Nymphaea colorata TaxID=210225 RepID=UPI00129D260F|nr:uncharacterized protein LOC116255848 isoform X2 [Nymphaea colorata]
MSGGFFRGTSADQDTRFSNKEAKLLKSQKFAPELEHTVDMTKVKLDVIRPWIANRVTELLGFEDEVLINFIFGLLDGKDVDGKQIQIQLTGFMEKNTGKFMKELWSLLVSAQKNISGVPQQFLDAKEEEAKKKKAEADRISREIQQKREKENRESEWEIKKKLGDENNDSRIINHASDASSKHLLPNVSNTHVEDNEVGRHKLQGKERFTRSPVEDRSPSLLRHSPPSPRPRSKSFSNTRSSSRSRSSERLRSRSISKSPKHRRRSPSVETRSYSPVRSYRYKRSPRHVWSPSRRRSPYLRRRSPLPARRMSPSPIRRKSRTPIRRRSLSPQYHRSPSFVRRRSPSPGQRSPSYVRRRSPRVRRRSPSPSRHRLPSPPRRRSPRYHRRSPAPSYRSRDAKVSPYQRSWSRSPYPSQSPPHRGHTRRSLSKEPRNRDRASDRPRGRRSPDVHCLEGEEHSGGRRKAESSARPLSTSLRSPQRDVMPQHEEPYRGRYKSPVYARKADVSEDESKQDQHGTRRPHVERQERGDASKRANRHSHRVHDGSESLRRSESREHSPASLGANSSPGSEDHLELSKSMKRSHSPRRDDGFCQDDYSNKPSRLSSHISEDIEYEPGRLEKDASQDRAPVRRSSSRQHIRDDLSPEKALNGANTTSERGYRTEKFDDDDYKRAVVKRSISNVENTCRMDTYESHDEENERSRHHSSDSKKQKREGIERKHKNHDDSDALSHDDERKEAQRRRKEDKKMWKEEKRRRREERHRRREEQRAIKMKGRSDNAREKSHKDGDISDGDEGQEISHQSDAEETELAQTKLEIELRNKALESLRAKKAISP